MNASSFAVANPAITCGVAASRCHGRSVDAAAAPAVAVALLERVGAAAGAAAAGTARRGALTVPLELAAAELLEPAAARLIHAAIGARGTPLDDAAFFLLAAAAGGRASTDGAEVAGNGTSSFGLARDFQCPPHFLHSGAPQMYARSGIGVPSSRSDPSFALHH